LSTKKTTETLWAFGHPNILAIHPTTLMITKDTQVSKNGDCIVAVAANKSLADFSTEFKEKLKKPDTKLSITISAEDVKEIIYASGTQNLILRLQPHFSHLCKQSIKRPLKRAQR
jgi:hypothetical protein